MEPPPTAHARPRRGPRAPARPSRSRSFHGCPACGPLIDHSRPQRASRPRAGHARAEAVVRGASYVQATRGGEKTHAPTHSKRNDTDRRGSTQTDRHGPTRTDRHGPTRTDRAPECTARLHLGTSHCAGTSRDTTSTLLGTADPVLPPRHPAPSPLLPLRFAVGQSVLTFQSQSPSPAPFFVNPPSPDPHPTPAPRCAGRRLRHVGLLRP